ncbi:MAG: 4-hydroxyphenylacetate 3-hydroxylase C-terminal domain-containing protein [Desulfatiglandales bacterium]
MTSIKQIDKRMIHDLIGSFFGAHCQIAGAHGGGSPIMEVIALLANYDFYGKKQIAEELDGIKI